MAILYKNKMIHFEIFQDTSGFYRWRLKAANGEIVSWSEAYASRQGAEISVAWMRKNTLGAPLY